MITIDFIDEDNAKIMKFLKNGDLPNINGKRELIIDAYEENSSRYNSSVVLAIRESRENPGLLLTLVYDPINGKSGDGKDITAPINILSTFGQYAQKDLKKYHEALKKPHTIKISNNTLKEINNKNE